MNRETSWNDLARQTLDSIEGSSPAAEYERQIARRILKRHTGEHDLSDLRLTVKMDNPGRVDAYAVSRVSAHMQNATALIAKAHRLTDPSVVVDKYDRKRALLVQEYQSGNVVVFRIAKPDEGMFGTDLDTPTASAIRDLVTLLPEREDDDTAMDQILGSVHARRSAVYRVAKAAVATKGLHLQLVMPGLQAIESVLTFDRAQALAENLGEKQEITSREAYQGKMDGLRNSRRLFYLIQPNGKEISGVVDPDQLSLVKDAVGEEVFVNVTGTQLISKSGSKSRVKYRLDRLTAVDKLPGL